MCGTTVVCMPPAAAFNYCNQQLWLTQQRRLLYLIPLMHPFYTGHTELKSHPAFTTEGTSTGQPVAECMRIRIHSLLSLINTKY